MATRTRPRKTSPQKKRKRTRARGLLSFIAYGKRRKGDGHVFLFTITDAIPSQSLLFRLDVLPHELRVSVDYPPRLQPDHPVVQNAAVHFETTRVSCLGLLGMQAVGKWWKHLAQHPEPSEASQRELISLAQTHDEKEDNPWAAFIHLRSDGMRWKIVADYLQPPLPPSAGLRPNAVLLDHIRQALVDAFESNACRASKQAKLLALKNVLDVHDALVMWMVKRMEFATIYP